MILSSNKQAQFEHTIRVAFILYKNLKLVPYTPQEFVSLHSLIAPQLSQSVTNIAMRNVYANIQ